MRIQQVSQIIRELCLCRKNQPMPRAKGSRQRGKRGPEDTKSNRQYYYKKLEKLHLKNTEVYATNLDSLIAAAAPELFLS